MSRALKLLLLASWAALAVPGTTLGEGRVPVPVLERGKGDRCVEPTPIMRRDHMRFLLHQRDETMRRGVRTKRHSLTECVSCHVGRDPQGAAVPVNAPGQFCESCHAYAAVSMDCFECHATTPPAGETGGTRAAGGKPNAAPGPKR
jgi:hypothetical protein